MADLPSGVVGGVRVVLSCRNHTLCTVMTGNWILGEQEATHTSSKMLFDMVGKINATIRAVACDR